MSRARRVVVTGLGLVSGHGQEVGAAFEAMLHGVSAIRMSAVGDAPHTTTIPSAVCNFEDAAPLLGRSKSVMMDRFSHLAVTAASAAWNDAGLEHLGEDKRERACVMLGTGTGGGQSVERGYRDLFVRGRARLSPLTVVQCMNNAAAAHIAQLYALGGACYTYSVACASAAAAIAEASRRIQWGECEFALAGGSESALPYATVRAWQSMQVLANADVDNAARACRPFAVDRGGLVLGEGAAMLVLEERDHAIARGARIYAELAGSGASCDHGHITTPSAAGQLRALQAALRDAEVAVQDVKYVNAHGTATPEGDPVEIDALRRCFESSAAQLPVSATKSMHGHLMGASGAIEAVMTAMAVSTGRIPPTAGVLEVDQQCQGVDHVLGAGREMGSVPVAISSSFAFGGTNVVLVFRAVH